MLTGTRLFTALILPHSLCSSLLCQVCSCGLYWCLW